MQAAARDQLIVRELRRDDLAEVARVHLAAFEGSALSRLGHEAVRRNYLWLLEGPHESYAIGAFATGRLVGFCFGGRFNGALTGFLHKNRVYLAARVLTHPWLAFGPLFRDRIVLGVKLLLARARRPRNAQPQPAQPASPPAFGILAIGVDPRAQGTGAGKALMLQSEERARQLAYAAMELCVAPTNDKAIRFYERLGWAKDIAGGGWGRNGLMTKSLE